MKSNIKNCCCGQGRICPSHGDTTPEERINDLKLPAPKKENKRYEAEQFEFTRDCPICKGVGFFDVEKYDKVEQDDCKFCRGTGKVPIDLGI